MTPSWLAVHASYIDRNHLKTTEQLIFNAGSMANAVILKVPIMPPDILEDSSLATLKIVASLDEDIGNNNDSDPRFGVSDGVSFVGFETVDKATYARGLAPCYGIEGTSGNTLGGIQGTSSASQRPKDTFYDGQFVITLKLNERWGSCYTAHDGGFVKTADYNKRMLLSKGLTLEVYSDHETERVGIKFIEVTVI